MAEDINVGINASSNFPSVVQKVVKSVESLENNLNDLVGVLEDMAKSSGNASASMETVGKSAKNMAKQVGDSVSTADKLRTALQLVGREGDQALKNLDFSKIDLKSLSAAEIEEFSKKLREAGTNLADFLTTGKIDLGFRPAIEELNQLQNLLKEPLSTPDDFSDTQEVFAELRRLNEQFRSEVADTMQELRVPDSVFSSVGELRAELAKLSDTGGAAGGVNLLLDFQENRAEAERVVETIDELRLKLLEVGPAAQSGNQEAIGQFRQLTNELRAADATVERFTQKIRGGQTQFNATLGSRNQALQGFGFRQITLEDIFPSSEQQRVAQLQTKINQAVRESIQEGAVRSALNNFLQLDPALENIDQNIVSLTSHLPRLRYALYDVSNTAGILGGALLGTAAAMVNVSAEFERAFADVIRTTELEAASTEANNLKEALTELSQDIPVSFADLADIATLAGQLNIASEIVDDFTESVAKFSATTDVTIEAAATAFGRLDQLVEGVDGQFDKLGSSILAVGINAVATESDIIAISTQIASVANIAGFSASELIGFSSALASVGTRPELARGTFTRLFTEIQQSVAEGGDQLNAFAQTANQSVQQFTDAWGAGSGADQVIAILRGLNVAGKEADQVLAQLGITSVRDVPTLLKLAQSIDEVETQIRIANIGFLEGTELNDQYSVITSTLSEKLQILKNNFTALVETLSGFTGSLTFVIDAAIGLIRILERILDNPINKFFLTLGTITAGVIGVLGLLGAALTRAGASFAGLLTATIETQEAIAFTTVGIAGLNGTLEATTASATRAAGAMSNLAGATAAAGQQTAKTGSDLVGPNGLPIVFNNTEKEAGKLSRMLKGGLSGGLLTVLKNSKLLTYVKLAGTVTAWGIGINLLTFALSEAAKYFNLFGMGADEANNRIENFDAYVAAAKKDTEEFNQATEEGRKNFITFERSVSDTNEELSEYVKLVLATNGEMDALTDYVNDVTGAFENQTIAIGENTKALIRQDLARQLIEASETVGGRAIGASFLAAFTGQEAITGATVQENLAIGSIVSALGDPELNRIINELGFDYRAFVQAIEEGNVELANSIAADVVPAFEKLRNIDPAILERVGITIEDIDRVTEVGASGLQRFTGIALDSFAALEQQKIDDILSGAAFEDVGEGAEVAADDLKAAFDQIIEGSFGVANAQNALSDSLESFGAVVANEGADAAATSQELQQVLQNIWDTSDNGFDAALTMAGFFNGIVDGGYVAGEALVELQDTIATTFRTFARQQIESLRLSKAGTQVMLNGIKVNRSRSGKELAAVDAEIAQIEEAINNFDTLLAMAPEFDITPIERGFRGVGSAAKEASEEVEEVQEEVRTLLDYGSDLESVFSRAFDLRFASQSSIDDITDAWENFTDQVEDARNSLEELQATQQDLAADRSIKEYFLSVAEAYDDQLRAAQLRSEIAELDREQAEAARELAEAEEASAGATSLTGQGPGARQNRQALLGLVRNYQDYITVLAESGAGQDELRAATEKARQEFIKQATELGFAEEEVMMYAEAFDDVRTAIDRIPRDVTIDFNADPALQALNELNAKLDQSIEKAKELNRQQRVDAGSRQTPAQTSTETSAEIRDRVIAQANTAELATARRDVASWQQRVIGLERSFGPTGGQNPQVKRELDFAKRQLQVSQEELKAIEEKGLYTGGFTGRGPRMEPAGIVHRGEYVIPKRYVNQSTGMPDPSFLAQLQNGVRGYQMGGFVGGPMAGGDGSVMVELSPYDRKLLENAGNVQLRLNGRVVAEATNQSNFNQARRGSD